MNGLGPQARRILELGKEVGEPDDAALARTRASLMGRVGAATAAVTTVAATAKAATAASPIAASSSWLAATPVAAKFVATAMVVCSIGAGAVAYRANLPTEPPASTVERPAPRAAVKPAPAQTLAPPRGGASAVAAPEPPESPAPGPAGRTVTPTHDSPPSVAPPADLPVTSASPASPADLPASPASPPRPASTLTADVASLREAQAALVAGNPQRALEAAERVQPSGPLSDEREGLRTLARCALGAPDAREEARAFVEQHPRAPLAIRVRSACLGGP